MLFVVTLFYGSAHSSLVEYRYEGRNFNYFESQNPQSAVFDTTNRVTFSLLLNSRLPSGLFRDVRQDVVSFEASDGDLTITDETASFRQFLFKIGAEGMPEFWSLGAYSGDLDDLYREISTGFWTNSFTSIDGGAIIQKVSNSAQILTLEKGHYLYPIGEFGTWTINAVDSSPPLLSLGLGIIAILSLRVISGRKKLAQKKHDDDIGPTLIAPQFQGSIRKTDNRQQTNSNRLDNPRSCLSKPAP